MLTPVYDIYGRDYYYFTISLYYLSLYHPILYLSYLVATVSLPVSHLTPLTHSRHLRGSSCSVPSLRHFPPFLPRSVSEGNAKRSARYAHPRSRLRRVRR